MTTKNENNFGSGFLEFGTDRFTIGGGTIIIIIGMLVLLLSATIDSFDVTDHFDFGKLAATGILMIMIGMAFRFPSLLKDDNHGLSTMRLVVFMIIAVFVTVVLKIGWDANSFDVLKIDSNWTFIIIAALTGKAVQAIGTKIAEKIKPSTPKTEKEIHKDDEKK